MSSIPGYTLEEFVAWGLDVVVTDAFDPNPSLRITEMLGTATRIRKRITEEQLADIVQKFFEPYREQVEYRLNNFEEEYMSWRDYAGYSFDFISEEVWKAARDFINEMV